MVANTEDEVCGVRREFGSLELFLIEGITFQHGFRMECI